MKNTDLQESLIDRFLRLPMEMNTGYSNPLLPSFMTQSFFQEERSRQFSFLEPMNLTLLLSPYGAWDNML